jgi:hypothetical protein
MPIDRVVINASPLIEAIAQVLQVEFGCNQRLSHDEMGDRSSVIIL